MEKKEEVSMEKKILEAAEKLFLDKGFARTPTTEIAKVAGCNHAMLHYYFRTKERLFEKIFENKIVMFAGAFHGPNIPGESFEDKLRRMIGSHFDILIENPKLPMLILSDMMNSPERIALAKEALGNYPHILFTNLSSDLEKEISNGNIRKITAQDLLFTILSLNIFTFVSLPMFTMVLEIPESQKSEFIAQRKKDITETILRSLRP